MKLFEAIKASPVNAAVRVLTDAGGGREGREPNIALMDGFPKAFRAVESFAWERRPVREAKKLTDWLPASSREVEPRVQLGEQGV